MNEIILRDSNALEVHRYCEFGSTYLKFSEDTPYDAWAFVMSRLQGGEKSLRWWIGDAIRFGERKYGEMYSQALDDTPYVYGTLANSVYVADHIEISLRSENLGFSHHAAVASLEPEEQEELLSKAEANGWTVKDTNEAAREVRMLPAAVRKKRAEEEVREEGEERGSAMMICPHCEGNGVVPVKKAKQRNRRDV